MAIGFNPSQVSGAGQTPIKGSAKKDGAISSEKSFNDNSAALKGIVEHEMPRPAIAQLNTSITTGETTENLVASSDSGSAVEAAADVLGQLSFLPTELLTKIGDSITETTTGDLADSFKAVQALRGDLNVVSLAMNALKDVDEATNEIFS